MSAARDNSCLEAEDDGISDPVRYASDESSSDASQAATGAQARIEAEEDETVSTGDPAQPYTYKTSVQRRAKSHIRRIRNSMTRFLTRFSKENWAAQSLAAHASAEGTAGAQGQPAAVQPAPAESDEQDEVHAAAADPEGTEPSAAPAEGAPAVGAQGRTSRVRKRRLVEPHAFLAISMPDGGLKYYTSQSIKDNELALHQRDAFVGAMSLIAKAERIRGSNDRRAEMAARKLVSDRMELAAGRHEPLSKQWRRCARQAFSAHIQPTNARLLMCPDERQDWKHCIVGPNSTTCTLGGRCSHAREAHGWPPDLACINPLRTTADTAWNIKFLFWQQRLGHDVTLPEGGAQRAPAPAPAVRVPALRGRQPALNPTTAPAVPPSLAAVWEADFDNPAPSAVQAARAPSFVAFLQGAATRNIRYRATRGQSISVQQAPAAPAQSSITDGNPSCSWAAGARGCQVAGTDVLASLKCGRCQMLFSHHACSSGNIVIDEQTTALQTRLCYPCALADPGVRMKGGGSLSETITAAAGSAAEGFSIAGAALLARGSADLSAAAGRSADAVAREAAGSGVDAAAEARPEGQRGTHQIGSLLPRAAMDICSAHVREGPQPAEAETCRPQREKRLPRKLADAAELCDTSEDFGGRGAQRRAAQALQAKAAPSAGQPQRASQRSTRSTAAVSPQRAADIETSEEPCLAVVPSAVTEEENREEEEARVASGPELCLIAVDNQYPIIPSIRTLLPDDECLLERVLSNSVAAKAIMHLTDTELCQNVMKAHGAHAIFVMLDGLPHKPSELSVLDLRRWAKMRDLPVENMREAGLRRAIWVYIKYSRPEELSNARARIANVVKEFLSVE